MLADVRGCAMVSQGSGYCYGIKIANFVFLMELLIGNIYFPLLK
jgi:hypothetical protein